MASDLTYTDFITHVPSLATPDTTEQTYVVQYLNHAELHVNRAAFGDAIIPTSNVSRADLAVIYLAAHYYALYVRAKSAKGLSSHGQVLGHTSNADGVSYAKIITSGADQALSATLYGTLYMHLRDSVVRVGLPLVL